ncbi:hypothetical protein [Prevotella histicola]|nr:hypothetical protein [Prevotella histicola]
MKKLVISSKIRIFIGENQRISAPEKETEETDTKDTVEGVISFV